MIITRRTTTQLLLGAAAASALPHPLRAAAETGAANRAHGASLVGTLNYPADFTRFEYVNPDAPKGGEAKLAAIGSFDSFNPFIVKGDPATGMGLIYDTLTTSTLDASSTEYGLLAEWIEWPEDYSWVQFQLREGARWHDGEPVTAADAVFSFETLTQQGAPFYRLYYGNVEAAEDRGEGVLRFRFNETHNRELPQIMGQLRILPKHFWAERDFTRSGVDVVPLGSGPYRIGDFETGRSLTFERVADYWGRDLPVNVGKHNFDRLHYEYFKDPNTAFDAFKVGKLDYREENSSINWATRYDFPAVKNGEVAVREIELDGPKAVQSFIFNTRRAPFDDRRVREALAMMFDFEWTNEAIFYGQYARPVSYFQGTEDLMAKGVPEGAERAILEEHRDALPPELFEKPFEMPTTDGSGRPDRRALRRAKALLQEAGWSAKGGELVNGAGEPMEIEFLIASKQQERVVAPFLRNLERLGVAARLRSVDSAQYVRRIQDHDFEMRIGGWRNSASPGNEQREYWGSAAAEKPGSRNAVGAADPVIDALIERLVFAKDRADLAAATRALDRVLLWGHYGVMELYTPFERVAYWTNRVAPPDPTPSHSLGWPSVWWSAQETGE